MKTKCIRPPWFILIILLPALASQILGFNTASPRGRAAAPFGEKASGNVQSVPGTTENMSPMFKGRIVEIIDAGRQYYLKIDNGSALLWVAVQTFDGKIGDRVLVPPGVPMADFYSRKLNRRFSMIYFVGTIRHLENSEEAEQ